MNHTLFSASQLGYQGILQAGPVCSTELALLPTRVWQSSAYFEKHEGALLCGTETNVPIKRGLMSLVRHPNTHLTAWAIRNSGVGDRVQVPSLVHGT